MCWHLPCIQILFACLAMKGFQCWFDDCFHICCSVSACLLPFAQDAFTSSVKTWGSLLKVDARSGCDSLCRDRAIAVYSQPCRMGCHRISESGFTRSNVHQLVPLAQNVKPSFLQTISLNNSLSVKYWIREKASGGHWLRRLELVMWLNQTKFVRDS